AARRLSTSRAPDVFASIGGAVPASETATAILARTPTALNTCGIETPMSKSFHFVESLRYRKPLLVATRGWGGDPTGDRGGVCRPKGKFVAYRCRLPRFRVGYDCGT